MNAHDETTPRPSGGAAWWHTDVKPGRYTAELTEPLAVFLIGMRINRPTHVRRWLWVMKAMPAMLDQLAQIPDLGLLHVEQFTRFRTTMSVQYWQSADHLMRFARDRDSAHLEPWRRLNREMRAADDVGFWHETYLVQPGSYEGIYVNMPLFGMGAATRHVPVGSHNDRAAQRLGVST